MAKKAKELPYNEVAEKAVIGSAIISDFASLEVVNSLTEDQFFLPKHQIIFRCIKALVNKGKHVDNVALTEELINIKEFENIGGIEYLRECADSMVALTSLAFYIQMIQDQAILRNLLVTMREIDDDYHKEEIEDVDGFVTKSKERIDKVLEKRHVASFKSTQDIVGDVAKDIEKMGNRDSEGDLIGINTGYDDINFFTQGFKEDEMIIVAARPAVGKTALCLNFAYRAATMARKTVGIFSLEMSRDSLVKRLLGMESRVPLMKINSGKLNAAERMKVSAAVDKLESAKIWIDDTPGSKLIDIITKSKKLKAQQPDLGLLIIDYLGLVQTSQTGRNPDSRQEEVRKISLSLKQLARDLKLPIIVVSQLSRLVESREGNKPKISDLRDSGNIEQDADIVMLLYREDYYNKKSSADKKRGSALTDQEKLDGAKAAKERAIGEKIPENTSLVEVNIAKNRNGQTGIARLLFFKEFGRFDSISRELKDEISQIQDNSGIDD